MHDTLHMTLCNTLQHTATHCNTLQHTATHCNTLQHTASHCITLHHTASHCNACMTLYTGNTTPPKSTDSSRCSVLQCVAVCCSVLQCVAVCCSVLQCVAVCPTRVGTAALKLGFFLMGTVALYRAAVPIKKKPSVSSRC